MRQALRLLERLALHIRSERTEQAASRKGSPTHIESQGLEQGYRNAQQMIREAFGLVRLEEGEERADG